MGRVDSRSVKSLPLVLLFALTPLFASGPAFGQAQPNPDAQKKVVDLIKSAMDSYANLDLPTATNALEEALGSAPELDKTTLARLYVAYGMVRIGGSGDNAGGQRDFVTALCLDGTVGIDPLFSSPDIDSVFATAGVEATPEACQQVLATITLPVDVTLGPPKGAVVDPGVPPCGMHTPVTEQRQRFEVPVYLELDPMVRTRLSKLVLKYSFDGAPEFRELVFTPAGAGYGAQITCDEGQIRVYDPAAISYYIEGYDHLGNLVCGFASAQGPQVVAMNPDLPQPIAAMGLPMPKECTPCAPWDKTCGQVAKPGDGEMCNAQGECAAGLQCGEAGICEPAKEAAGKGKGPKHFYVNAGGGAGFGAMGKDMSASSFITQNENGENVIAHPESKGGFAFGGVPVRLEIGAKIKDWLSVEVGLRLDVTKLATMDSNVQSCWEAAGGDLDRINGTGDYAGDGPLNCTSVDGLSPGPDPYGGQIFGEDLAKQSVALTSSDEAVKTTTPHAATAWLVNARARFRVFQKGGLNINLFAGLGYGHIMYLVKSGAGDSFYPAPGFFDIEVGPVLIYYFNTYVGIGLEVPIDVLVGDGWALNFDPTVLLSVGF
jgi:hypothetical protein